MSSPILAPGKESLDYVIAKYVLHRFYDWLDDNIGGDKILMQVDEYIEYFLRELEPE